MKRLCVLGLVIGLLVSVAACGGAEPVTKKSSSPTAKPATAKEWVKVISLKGDGTVTSPSFRLKGGEQKLTYTVKGKQIPIAAFYVEEAGTDLLKQGGFPVATMSKAGSGSATFSRGKGKYTVIVTAANCTWTCTVSELR